MLDDTLPVPRSFNFAQAHLVAGSLVEVSIFTASHHPLCPSGRSAGPFTFRATMPLAWLDSVTLDAIERSLLRIGQRLTGEWQRQEIGYSAWCEIDPCWVTSPDSETMFAALDSGRLP